MLDENDKNAQDFTIFDLHSNLNLFWPLFEKKIIRNLINV